MPRFVAVPTVDPRFLSVFLICATQDGYVDELLGTDKPDYDNSEFTRLGLAADIQKQFVATFGGRGKGANRAAFVEVVKLFKQLANYHPPDCPYTAVLKAVVQVTNDAFDSQ